ncbi:MAG TPA: hypothetical protein VFS23_35360 [Vicinamibacterales bacterium]|nr:hypothetical protein [Vicinamibacterales bacterium]
MKPQRLWMIASAFAVLLISPRIAEAGIGEFIWEMSGPQMVGGGIECKLNFSGDVELCYITIPITGLAKAPMRPRRFRVSLDGGVYVSTGKNAGGVDYEAWKTWMLAFDPMIELVTWDNLKDDNRQEIYHGLMGVSYNVLFGPDFRRFANAGVKLRPIGYRYRRVNFEFDLRIYPNGFSADQFGKAAAPEPNRAEVTYGFSMGIAFGES